MPLISSGTYSDTATTVSKKYWYDRYQSSLTITNNDSEYKIVVTISDENKTIFPGKSHTFDEEFISFQIKALNKAASFTAVSTGLLSNVNSEISSLEAATANKAYKAFVVPEEFETALDTDDTNSIQLAIDYCNSNVGGTVILSKPSYTVTNVVIKPFVSFIGYGIGVTYLNGSDADKNVITVQSDAVYWKISGLSIVGKDGTGTGSGIYIMPGTQKLLSTINFIKPESFVPNENGYKVKNGCIENIRSCNNGHSGIYVSLDSATVFIHNIQLYKNKWYGLYDEGIDNIYTNILTYLNGHYGLYIAGANHKIANIKSYFNCGDTSNVDDILLRSAIRVTGDRNILSTCETQDNYGNGYCNDGDNNIFVGCIADADGLLYTDTTMATSSQQHYGFLLNAGSHNSFSACRVTNYRNSEITPYLKAVKQNTNGDSDRYDFDFNANVATLPSDVVSNAYDEDGKKVSTDFFTGINNLSNWSANAINAGTVDSNGVNYLHVGLVGYNSSTTPNSGYSINTASMIQIVGRERTTFIFRTSATTTTGITRRMGFLDSATSTTPSNGVYAEILDGVLSGNATKVSVNSTTSTNYTLTQGTWYRLVINIISSTEVVYTLYADNSRNILWSDKVTTNVPTATSLMHGDICTYSGSSAVSLGKIDYMDFVLPYSRRIM